MYMTRKDFETIDKALSLLPSGEAFNKLSKADQEIILKADRVLINLAKKRKKDNARQAAYIAEKRKIDKNYARSRKTRDSKTAQALNTEEIKQALYNARLDFDCIGEDLQAEIDSLTDSELIRLYNDYCVAE